MEPALTENRLVDDCFTAALHPGTWPSFLQNLSAYVDGAAINLIGLDKVDYQPVLDLFECGDISTYTSYITHYVQHDIRVPRIIGAPTGKILLEDDLFTPEEKRTDLVYNELMAQNKMRNLAVTNLTNSTLNIGLAIAPKNDAIPFTKDQLFRFARIAPHVRNAVRVYIENRTLQLQRGALGDLWAYAGKAILLLDEKGQVLFRNMAAEEYERGGLTVTAQSKLRFQNPRTEQIWQMQQERLPVAGNSRFAEFIADTPDGETQLIVRLIRPTALPEFYGPDLSPAFLMLISPLSAEVIIDWPEIERFSQLFGISPAESKVIGAIAKGQSFDDLARENHVAVDTIRKQAKAALAKCGVRSQKALISRLERFCLLTTK